MNHYDIDADSRFYERHATLIAVVLTVIAVCMISLPKLAKVLEPLQRIGG